MQFTFDVLPIVWGSQSFEIRSGDPGYAHLGVILRFIRRRGPSCTVWLYQIGSG